MKNYTYGSNWKQLSEKCKRMANYRCQKCGKDCSKNKIHLHAHHIIPLSKGGRNTLSNLIALCDNCHSLVHGRDLTLKHTRRTP